MVARLNEAVQKAAQDPEVISRLEAAGLDVRTNSPEVMAQKVLADYRKWSTLLFNSRITVN